MPNTNVRADAEGVPTINRRRAMLSAGATMAALAATTLPAKSAMADADLIRLGRQAERLRTEYLPLGADASHATQGWIDECAKRGISLEDDRANGFAIAEEVGSVTAARAAGWPRMP